MKFILFDRRLAKNFDWIIFILTLCISAVGIIVIYSATGSGLSPSNLYIKQIYWVCYGLLAMLLVITVDYHQVERFAYILYLIMVTLLFLVLYHGKVAGGAQRWLSLGGLNIQPSEISKIIIVIFLARYFDEN
ncbi:MAG: FtsW/RodA/SpoVE family cell cycle protein, partial [Nitrospinota bacterium]